MSWDSRRQKYVDSDFNLLTSMNTFNDTPDSEDTEATIQASEIFYESIRRNSFPTDLSREEFHNLTPMRQQIMANIYKILDKYLFAEAGYAIKEFFKPLLFIYRYIFKSDDNHSHGGA